MAVDRVLRPDERTAVKGCPACGRGTLEPFLEIPAVPVFCNVLWPGRAAALAAPRGDIRLAFCRNCGLVYNVAFDPSLVQYGQRYENSLHFSPRFQQYARELAVRLVETHALHGKRVIGIGCGDAGFLKLLCEAGVAGGLGFDPAYHGDDLPYWPISIIRDKYSEAYVDEQADLVTCRHLLEHIEGPREFLAVVRRAIGDRQDTVLYFEVPDFTYTLGDLGIWDIIYEHCSYFTSASLARLFERSGFAVERVESTYGGQFLGLEATPNGVRNLHSISGAGLASLADAVASFADVYRAKVDAWSEHVRRTLSEGKRIAVWGAGSKGVTFLNTVSGGERISLVVDISPRKQGMHVAGTGQRIRAPQALRDDPPDIVLAMNPIYQDEIGGMLAELGVPAKVRTV
jgi:hypothetical protein